MAGHDLEAVSADVPFIPDLRSKFDVLRSLGPRHDWVSLAQAFGKSPKTLRWWINGDDFREPGTIPAESLPALIDLIVEAMGGEPDPARGKARDRAVCGICRRSHAPARHVASRVA